MKHFDIVQWTDFARGVTPDHDRDAMETHLGSGCARCRETFYVVKRVVQAARADSRSEPPEHVVRCAKAIGSLMLPSTSGLSRLIGRLVGDAFPHTAVAGMR